MLCSSNQNNNKFDNLKKVIHKPQQSSIIYNYYLYYNIYIYKSLKKDTHKRTYSANYEDKKKKINEDYKNNNVEINEKLNSDRYTLINTLNPNINDAFTNDYDNQIYELHGQKYYKGNNIGKSTSLLIDSNHIISDSYIMKEILIEKEIFNQKKLNHLTMINHRNLARIYTIQSKTQGPQQGSTQRQTQGLLQGSIQVSTQGPTQGQIQQSSSSSLSWSSLALSSSSHVVYYFIMKRYKLNLIAFLNHINLNNSQELKMLYTIFRNIYQCIQELKTLGYYHPNLKPENIFIEGDGNVIITDYFYEDIMTYDRLKRKLDIKFQHPEYRTYLKNNVLVSKPTLENIKYWEYPLAVIFMDYYCQRNNIKIANYDHNNNIQIGIEILKTSINAEFAKIIENIIAIEYDNPNQQKPLCNDDGAPLFKTPQKTHNFPDYIQPIEEIDSLLETSRPHIIFQDNNTKPNQVLNTLIEMIMIDERNSANNHNIPHSRCSFANNTTNCNNNSNDDNQKLAKTLERSLEFKRPKKQNVLSSVINKQNALKKAREATPTKKRNQVGSMGKSFSTVFRNLNTTNNNQEDLIDKSNILTTCTKRELNNANQPKSTSQRIPPLLQKFKGKRQNSELLSPINNTNKNSLNYNGCEPTDLYNMSQLLLKKGVNHYYQNVDTPVKKENADPLQHCFAKSYSESSFNKQGLSKFKNLNKTKFKNSNRIIDNPDQFDYPSSQIKPATITITTTPTTTTIVNTNNTNNLIENKQIVDETTLNTDNTIIYLCRNGRAKEGLMELTLKRSKSKSNNTRIKEAIRRSRESSPSLSTLRKANTINTLSPKPIVTDVSDFKEATAGNNLENQGFNAWNIGRFVDESNKSRESNLKTMLQNENFKNNICLLNNYIEAEQNPNTLSINDTFTDSKPNFQSNIKFLDQISFALTSMQINTNPNLRTDSDSSTLDLLAELTTTPEDINLNKENKNGPILINTINTTITTNTNASTMNSKSPTNNLIHSNAHNFKSNSEQSKIEVIHLDIPIGRETSPTPYRIIKKCLYHLISQNKIKLNNSSLIIKDPATEDYYYILNKKNAALIYYGQINSKGQKHGQGHYFQNNEVYIGKYVLDLKHGTGIYFYTNNQHYEGEWSQDLRHGEGSLYSSKNKILMCGTWQNGELNGNGIFYYDNGQVYEGEFRNSKFHGTGILFYENGMPHYEGTWKNGMKNGKFKIFDKEGNLINQSYYEDDKECEKYPEYSKNTNSNLIKMQQQAETDQSISKTNTPKFKSKNLHDSHKSTKSLTSEGDIAKKPYHIANLTSIDIRLMENPLAGITTNVANYYLEEMKIEHEIVYMNNDNTKDLLYYLSPEYNRLFFINDDFLIQLTNGSFNPMNWNYDAVHHIYKKYTGKGFTIFDLYDRILLLIKEKDSNCWALAEINCKDEEKFEFIIYDPNKNSKYKNNICLTLCKFAESEIKQRCMENDEDFSIYMSKIGNCEFVIADVVKQERSINSGIFILGIIKKISNNETPNIIDNELETIKNEIKQRMVHSYFG